MPVSFLSPSRFVLLVCGLSICLVAGCGSDPRGHDVSGTVTFNGAPVPAGDIQFIPASGNSGPPGRAAIKDGKYDTAAEGGKATVGGPHDVIINGFDGNAQPESEMPQGKPLFQEFKSSVDVSKDEATVKDFAVK